MRAKANRADEPNAADNARVFDIDPSYCPRCGAQRRIIAAINEPALIATVLQHLAMRVEHGRGARAPQTAPLQ